MKIFGRFKFIYLHPDNKRFLCLFVKFVLYRGPVLCEKHRIFFFFSSAVCLFPKDSPDLRQVIIYDTK